MVNIKSLSPSVLGDVRECLGLGRSDHFKDSEIAAMSPEEFLNRYLVWNGIIGYTGTIMSILASCEPDAKGTGG